MTGTLRGFFLVSLSIILLSATVRAHELKNVTPEYQQWAQEVYITASGRKWLQATHKRHWVKCCNKAEIVSAKYIIHPDGEDGWRWNDKGTVRDIPPEIIQWGICAPKANEEVPACMPTLFVYDGLPTCFFPPRGGL